MADIHVTQAETVTVISFPVVLRRLREPEVEGIAATFLSAVQGASDQKVLVDLEGVEFFGSSFIELMVRGWNRVKEAGDRRFALCNVSDYCLEVLQVTHIDEIWPRFNSRKEGIESLAQL